MPGKNVFPILILLSVTASLSAQQERLPFLEPADTFHRGRFWISAGIGTALYGSASYGLYKSWYAEHETSSFHFFNDMGQWNDVDKLGHAFTAYAESVLLYKGARWTGIKRPLAIGTAAGLATILQGTVEVMDGFSEEWGFSVPDLAYNTLGIGLFASQELIWREQRILLKVSNTRPDYPDFILQANNGDFQTTPRERAYDLYGSSFAEAFIKDYNGMTVWASINPASFLAGNSSAAPFKWLNLALGYGAENMYGAYGNGWTGEQGGKFSLTEPEFQRYRQYYLSLDIDFDRLDTESRLLRTLFSLINWIKVPSPTLELNSRGNLKFHPVFW